MRATFAGMPAINAKRTSGSGRTACPTPATATIRALIERAKCVRPDEGDHQRQSGPNASDLMREIIRGNQRRSEVIRAKCVRPDEGDHQRQSEAIRGFVTPRSPKKKRVLLWILRDAIPARIVVINERLMVSTARATQAGSQPRRTACGRTLTTAPEQRAKRGTPW